MPHSRPKSSSLFAVVLFLLILVATTSWLVVSLLKDWESYFLWKILLIPTLFVIAIIVSVKSYFGALTLSLGKDRISYQYPLSTRKSYKLNAIMAWDEEVIKRKSSTYKQLSIELINGKKLTISNHENSNYTQVVDYLRKKVRKT